jgi:hypothetical protein
MKDQHTLTTLLRDAKNAGLVLGPMLPHPLQLHISSHDTGCQIRIYAGTLFGDDYVPVWEGSIWYSHIYQFNNRNKTLGLHPQAAFAEDILEKFFNDVETAYVQAEEEARQKKAGGGRGASRSVGNMKILVIIPTHDRQQFIIDAIDSLRNQTRLADQVIVTGNVVPSVHPNGAGWYSACAVDCVTLLQSDLSLVERLNQAVESSECDAFMILADDDKLDESYIEKTVERIESSGADIVTTSIRWFGGDGMTPAEVMELAMRRSVFQVMGEPHISSLVKRSAWEKAGRYQAASYFDQDLWLRMKAAGCGRVEWIQEPLLWYRVHEGQDSGTVTIKEHERIQRETRERYKRL